MATREPHSIRLSTEEKQTFEEKAQSYGMRFGEFARYSMSVSPPPSGSMFMSGATPEFRTATLPSYDQLVSQVQTHSRTLDDLASSDPGVAQALAKARAALGPREE